MPRLQQVASVPLPTPFGVFEARVFESDSELVHLALVGTVGDGEDVLTRLHSECLTGDALDEGLCSLVFSGVERPEYTAGWCWRSSPPEAA